MSQTVQEVLGSVSRNIKRLRQQRDVSLSALAEAADISKSTLFKLERGEGNPSIDTLWSLARALSVPLAVLFAEAEGAAVQLLHYEDAPLVGRRGTRIVRAAAGEEGFVMRRALSLHERGELEAYWIDLDAGATRDERPHPAGVIEHVLVVCGAIEVTIEDATTVVRAGDRLTFSGDRAHRYYAVDGPARSITLLDHPPHH
jgi:XRE family transcriptional regulator, regulator of sulfur utilization